MKAMLYIEGGGRGYAAASRFREAWRKFFEAGEVPSRAFSIVRGESRERTWDRFKTAVQECSAEVLPILVVDSEGPVSPDVSVWQHLGACKPPWPRPRGIGDNQAFLMIQVMETWFLADSEGLRRFFAPNFSDGPLNSLQNLETIDKKTVFKVLDKATAGQYAKGDTSFKLLKTLDPKKVEAACPQAKRLFERLRSL